MERVQHYASVDARKCLEPGVARERYKLFVVWTGLREEGACTWNWNM